MKKVICTVLVLFNLLFINAQNESDIYAAKVSSIDSIITNLYGVISGDKGIERDWELFKYLFHPDAKLIPTGKNQQGEYGAQFMTPNDYIKTAGNYLVENGFHEVEINQTVDTFGNITQVFSTYESFHNKLDEKPFMRGINSIQLLNDGNRWWIINIYWKQETAESPIPEQYLPKN